MEALKKIFPLSAKSEDAKSLLIGLAIYIIVSIVCGVILGLLGAIPFVGFVFNILSWIIRMYCIVGIVISFLFYSKVIK